MKSFKTHPIAAEFAVEDFRDLRFSRVSRPLIRMYHFPWLRSSVIYVLRKLEKDRFTSGSRRVILKDFHGVYVGAYSYGSCLSPGQLHERTVVGRYVSMGAGMRIYRRNHPADCISMHPYFYNPKLGRVFEAEEEPARMLIGHDCWIGDSVTVTPRCSSIGIGSIVGACSVVTKDVPDFAIVAGSPAKIRGFRFTENQRAALLDSRWWELPIDSLSGQIDLFRRPLGCDFQEVLDRLKRAKKQAQDKTCKTKERENTVRVGHW